MGEHVEVTLLIRTVTVPRNTPDHTVRTEVRLHTTRQWWSRKCTNVFFPYLQPVNVLVGMEERVTVHPCLLTVTVPVVTRDPTARKEVTRAQPGI